MTTRFILGALLTGLFINPPIAAPSAQADQLAGSNSGGAIYRPSGSDVSARERGSTGETNPILRPIAVHFTAFTGSERGSSPEYVGRFQSALEKYLGQQGIRAAEGRSGWTITGQVYHVEGPDTPFLTQVCLYHSGSRGNSLVGCWSGRAESVFHFNDRLRNAAVHRYGLAGEIGDRIKGALAVLEAQEQVGARLDTLHAEGLKLRLESAEPGDNRETAPIQFGDVVSVRPDSRLRLQVTSPRAKAVIALAQDRSGHWLPLFVPDQEEGVFADSTISFPIDAKTALDGIDGLTIWVISTDSDTFRKHKSAGAPPAAEAGGNPDAVRVISGTPRQSGLWQANPMLRELALGGSNEFHALKFTLRKNTTLTKPYEAPSR